MDQAKKRSRVGDLSTYARDRYAYGEIAFDLYRKGEGPAVLVMPELPNISPTLLGFADQVVARGMSVVVPDFFGAPGKDLERVPAWKTVPAALRLVGRLCVQREFYAFALGRTSPVVAWLRALAAHEHRRCGGPGVGVVGMCFTGGFALATATDPRILAPVVSQPSLPIPINAARARSISCSDEDLAAIAHRCRTEDLKVIGLRFKGDKVCPGARFAMLEERLQDGFIAVELEQHHGHPEEPYVPHHSVLTRSLIDAPGEPTYEALQQVLDFLQTKLGVGSEILSR